MSANLHLFEAFGVELEYMIVDRRTLDVRPIADEVLRNENGESIGDVERGAFSWCNELVNHVIEIKTTDPAPALAGLASGFEREAAEINRRLRPLGGALMPTAMHPWMDPLKETRLWPHEYSPVYEAFDRIFNCQGHGWSNLQSAHLNLPFCGDEEFSRLHAAVRLVLPILPALAAASPVMDGRLSGIADSRLETYRHNARRVPSVSGRIIPEQAFSRAEYEERILAPMYRHIAPHDPEGILQHEWLNARGAIARFDRGSIEIRVLDVQECPAADLANLQLIVAMIRAMVEERWCSHEEQKAWPIEPLEAIFLQAVKEGDRALLTSPDYLRAFGLPASSAVGMPMRDFWRYAFSTLLSCEERAEKDLAPLCAYFEEGCLSQRIERALYDNAQRDRLADVYGELIRCLGEGRVFRARR